MAVPEGVEIGAVRISASGWEGAIVQGLKASKVHCKQGALLMGAMPFSAAPQTETPSWLKGCQACSAKQGSHLMLGAPQAGGPSLGCMAA